MKTDLHVLQLNAFSYLKLNVRILVSFHPECYTYLYLKSIVFWFKSFQQQVDGLKSIHGRWVAGLHLR